MHASNGEDRFFARVHARERVRIRTRALNFLVRTYNACTPAHGVTRAHAGYIHARRTCVCVCARTCTHIHNIRTPHVHVSPKPFRSEPSQNLAQPRLSRSLSSPFLPQFSIPLISVRTPPPLSPATPSLIRPRPSRRPVSLLSRSRPLSTRTSPSPRRPRPPARPVSPLLPSPTFTAVLHLT